MPDLTRILEEAMQDDPDALRELLRYMERNQLQETQFFQNILRCYSFLDRNWSRDCPPGASWEFKGDPGFGANYRHLAQKRGERSKRLLSLCGTKVRRDGSSGEHKIKCINCLRKRHWIPIHIEHPNPQTTPRGATFWTTQDGTQAHCFKTYKIEGRDWYVSSACSESREGQEMFTYINRLLSGYCYIHPLLFLCPQCVKMEGEPEDPWYQELTDL